MICNHQVRSCIVPTIPFITRKARDERCILELTQFDYTYLFNQRNNMNVHFNWIIALPRRYASR